MRPSNSYGNTGKQVRKFLRENGYKPTVGMVERVQREVSRTESQNEAIDRVHKEMERERGVPATVDMKGRDASEAVRRAVQRQLAQRQPRR